MEGAKTKKIMIDNIKQASAILKGVKNDADVDQAVNDMYEVLKDSSKEEVTEFITDEYSRLMNESRELLTAVTLQQQLEKYKEIIPMSYIARKYFGKSAAWLLQRVNGYPVRGKVYTLKPEEVSTLNQALHDIGNTLGSLTVQSC